MIGDVGQHMRIRTLVAVALGIGLCLKGCGDVNDFKSTHFSDLTSAAISGNALVICGDYSNERAWASLTREIVQPVGEFAFIAHVDFVYNPSIASMTENQIINVVAESSDAFFVFYLPDGELEKTEPTLVLLDFEDRDSIRRMKLIPKAVQTVENNLTIANLLTEEFQQEVDDDGIYRDFSP